MAQSCRLVALDLSIGSAGTEGVVAVRDDSNGGTGGKRKPFDVADVAVVTVGRVGDRSDWVNSSTAAAVAALGIATVYRSVTDR